MVFSNSKRSTAYKEKNICLAIVNGLVSNIRKEPQTPNAADYSPNSSKRLQIGRAHV